MTQSYPQFEEPIKKYDYSFKILVSTSFIERNNGKSFSRTYKKTFILFPKITSIVVKKTEYNSEITFSTEESEIYAYAIVLIYLVCLFLFTRSAILFINKARSV